MCEEEDKHKITVSKANTITYKGNNVLQHLSTLANKETKKGKRKRSRTCLREEGSQTEAPREVKEGRGNTKRWRLPTFPSVACLTLMYSSIDSSD